MVDGVTGESIAYAASHAEEETISEAGNAITLLLLMEDEIVQVHHQSRYLVMSNNVLVSI